MKNLGRYNPPQDKITADFLEFTQQPAQSYKVIRLNSNFFACPSCYEFPTRSPLGRFCSDTRVSMPPYLFVNLRENELFVIYADGKPVNLILPRFFSNESHTDESEVRNQSDIYSKWIRCNLFSYHPKLMLHISKDIDCSTQFWECQPILDVECRKIHLQVSEQISQEATHDQLVFDMDYIFVIPTSLFSRRNTTHTFKPNMSHKSNE